MNKTYTKVLAALLAAAALGGCAIVPYGPLPPVYVHGYWHGGYRY